MSDKTNQVQTRCLILTTRRARAVVLNILSVIQIDMGLVPVGAKKKRGSCHPQFDISVSKVREKASRCSNSSHAVRGPTYRLLYLAPKPNQLPLSMSYSRVFLPRPHNQPPSKFEESSVVYQLCSNVSCRMLPMGAMPVELRLGERS